MHRLIHTLTSIPKRLVAIVALLIVAMLTLSACVSSHSGNGQKRESTTQQSNYDRLVAAEPAHTMPYSSTRHTINFWIDTWSKPGKLAYVYLQNDHGDLIGFYVLQGPPVSMCTSLTPNYKIIQDQQDNGQMSVPAPSIDGAFYSGGECNTYYGQDATSNAFIEYTVGLGINVLLYDQPLPNHPNVKNLSPTTK